MEGEEACVWTWVYVSVCKRQKVERHSIVQGKVRQTDRFRHGDSLSLQYLLCRHPAMAVGY